jgi:hypothetical protein
MSRNFMQSTAELCFADRDFLPSYCRAPERRESYRSNPDTDEAQRYFGAENDFDYLCSAETRQDDEGFDFGPDDLCDDVEEAIMGPWAELDADEAEYEQPLHEMRCVLRSVPCVPSRDEIECALMRMDPRLSSWYYRRWTNPRHPLWGTAVREASRLMGTRVVETYVPARPPQEPIDPEDAAIRRQSRVEAREAINRSYRLMDRSFSGDRGNRKGDKPQRPHGSRETIRG